MPVVDGTTTDANAWLTITQISEIPGNAVLHVMAEDSVHENTYTVHFYTLASDQGVFVGAGTGGKVATYTLKHK